MSGSGGLVARELCCQLGDFRLEIASLTIGAGCTTAIVGPTGAGKTTLLRVLAGLSHTVSGEILWNERTLSASPGGLAVRRQVTLVPQRPLLLRGTVLTNVGYGLRCRNAKGVREASLEMLTRLRIENLAHREGGSLSVGQTQLVALARALVIRPQLLLLDEPSSNLDPANVALVENTIRETCQQDGTTVVWVTHNLFQARRVSDQTVFLWDGRLIESSPTAQFFTTPQDSRSADFVNGKIVY